MKDELTRRSSHLDLVEALFRAYPGVWLHAREFEGPGGRQAWRSRIAECRTQRGMYIENKQRRTADSAVQSYYRFLPQGAPLGRDPQTPAPHFEKHPPIQKGLPL